MKNKPEIETMYEVWPNTGDGWHVEVGPDRDALGLIEIRYKDDSNKITDRLSFTPEFANLVADAIKWSVQNAKNKLPQ